MKPPAHFGLCVHGYKNKQIFELFIPILALVSEYLKIICGKYTTADGIFVLRLFFPKSFVYFGRGEDWLIKYSQLFEFIPRCCSKNVDNHTNAGGGLDDI